MNRRVSTVGALAATLAVFGVSEISGYGAPKTGEVIEVHSCGPGLIELGSGQDLVCVDPYGGGMLGSDQGDPYDNGAGGGGGSGVSKDQKRKQQCAKAKADAETCKAEAASYVYDLCMSEGLRHSRILCNMNAAYCGGGSVPGEGDQYMCELKESQWETPTGKPAGTEIYWCEDRWTGANAKQPLYECRKWCRTGMPETVKTSGAEVSASISLAGWVGASYTDMWSVTTTWGGHKGYAHACADAVKDTRAACDAAYGQKRKELACKPGE